MSVKRFLDRIFGPSRQSAAVTPPPAGAPAAPPSPAAPAPPTLERIRDAAPFSAFPVPDTTAALSGLLTRLEPADDAEAWRAGTREPGGLAQIAMLRAQKADFYMARKFLAQADVASSCEPWAFAAYRDIGVLERAAAENAAKIDMPPDRASAPFEFLIVHSMHVGSTAIHNFLALHPELLPSQKFEIDVALSGDGEMTLAAGYAAKQRASRTPVRCGIVQHGYVAGASGPVDVAERLSRVVRRDRFHHVVRHPTEVLRSLYNNYFINQVAGGFHFPGAMNFPAGCRLTVDPSAHWPARWEIPKSGLPKPWTSRPAQKAAATATLSVDDDSLQRVVAPILERMKYAGVAETYGPWFDEWVPLDARDFFPENIARGARELFKSLGVDPGYSHPSFDAVAANRLRIAMINNFIELTGLEHPLYVSLDFAGQSLCAYTFPMIELAWLKPDERWQAAGFGDQEICLVASHDQWANLSADQRRRLLSDGILHEILDTVALPAWIDCHPAWQAAVDDHLLVDWRDLMTRDIVSMDRLRNVLGRDVARFLERRPDFAARWPGVEDLI